MWAVLIRPAIPASTGSAAERGCEHVSSPPRKHRLTKAPLCLKEESILHCEQNDMERGPKRRVIEDTSIWTCIIECYADSSRIMSQSHMILCCPITPFLPGGSFGLLSSFSKISAFVLLLQSISSPSLLLFGNERGMGGKKNKKRKYIWKMHSLIKKI